MQEMGTADRVPTKALISLAASPGVPSQNLLGAVRTARRGSAPRSARVGEEGSCSSVIFLRPFKGKAVTV